MSENIDLDDPSPLSLVELPEGSIKLDVELSDKYRDYSSELLRLSLLGIGGIGFLVKDLSSGQMFLSKPVTRVCLVISLGCLGISAASALLNRRASTSSISMHLVYIRLRKRGAERDVERAEWAKNKRDDIAHRASMSLKLSIIFLGLGALFLAFSFIWAISLSPMPQ